MADEEQVVEEQQDQEGEVQPPQVDPQVEDRARKMGWVPQDSFRGDPERWQDAESFVRRADELMPIMKSQLKRYEDRIAALESEKAGTRKTIEKLVTIGEKVSQRAYEQAKADIIRRQADAVAAGDTDTWAKLEEQKDKLEQPEKIEVPREAGTPDAQNPQFMEWQTENEWYMTDPDMTMYANAYAQQYPPNQNVPYSQWLNSVGSAVKKAFPHKFGNPNRNRTSPVDGGAQRGGPVSSKQKNYSHLPADAKKQCDNLVATIPGYTREKYVADYFEGEE